MKKALLPLILILLLVFLINNIFANAQKKTFLLGLAIVEDITEDESGLAVLDGLFSITNFRKLPAVDNFKVYSRWTGTGEHKIKVQIVDSENNVINETEEEELIFEEDFETYYFSHDFNNTVFQKPGVYWVQAILDDEVELEIPLFIQLSGEEVQFELKSELPVLIFSVPAVEIYEKDNGLQAVSGVFEYFSFRKFPAADDFIIANGWYSGDGEFEQHIEILDPDNNVIYKSEPQVFENGPKTITAVYDDLIDFIFQKPGLYIVRVYLGEECVFEYPIIVEQR